MYGYTLGLWHGTEAYVERKKMMEYVESKSPGQVAYEAYMQDACADRDGRGPTWSQIENWGFRSSWEAAAKAVMDMSNK